MEEESREWFRPSPLTNLSSTGQGNSPSAVPRETMGFQERNWLSTITDRASRSAEERLRARIRTRVDKCGALRARQLAKQLLRGGVDDARVILGWAPGGDAPFLIEASTIQGGVILRVPRDELPSDEWFTIKRPGTDRARLGRRYEGRLLLPSLCSLGAMRTIPPLLYLIAISSYNLRGILIALAL